MSIALAGITITFNPFGPTPNAPQLEFEVNTGHCGELTPSGDFTIPQNLIEGLQQYALALKRSIDTNKGS